MGNKFNLNTFDFVLPTELIAQYPPIQRGASRLLHLNIGNCIHDLLFQDLPQLLQPGDVLILNNTKVLPARLYGRKSSGGRVEILIERLQSLNLALAHVRANKPCRVNSCLILDCGVKLQILDKQAELFQLHSITDFSTLMQQYGQMPLPPYINRNVEITDQVRYQTVYAQKDGAIAAPTAGLHFTSEMLQQLQQFGINIAYVTLHVGAGTFRPVRVTNVENHVMHSEWCEVSADTCKQIYDAHTRGNKVIAVGTTSMRSLETAAATGILHPYQGETQLFIRPGYKFKVADALITNFHLPRSTLLMLVCAFSGTEAVLAAYRHAVETQYRFFSYGDAMFLHHCP
jgi:S-adenosylmethionine:tRNA ribosyltransferase-isomerase